MLYNHCPLILIGITFRTKPVVHILTYVLLFTYIYVENKKIHILTTTNKVKIYGLNSSFHTISKIAQIFL